jgi:hypothetical protein
MGRESEKTPRWVLVSALIAAVLVVVFIILVLTGQAGEHGPGRHTGASAGVTQP